MVRHIVMFWVSEPKDAYRAEAARRLKSLEGQIDGLLSVEVAADEARTGRSCDLCLNMTFRDWASLEAYRTHPLHLPVQAYMHQVRTDSRAADYTLPE